MKKSSEKHSPLGRHAVPPMGESKREDRRMEDERIDTPLPVFQRAENEIPKHLFENPFFAGISTETSRELSDKFHFKTIPPNEVLLEQGETGKAAFFLLKGRVCVYLPSHEAVVTTLGPGSLFGEIALLFDEKRTASVKTEEWCLVGVVTKDDFYDVFKEKKAELERIKTLARKRYEETKLKKDSFLLTVPETRGAERGTASLVPIPGSAQCARKKPIAVSGNVLDLSKNTNVAKSAFVSFANDCEEIKTANISGCLFVDDECVAALCRKQPGIREIDASFCPNITAVFFESVFPARLSLRTVTLARCNGIASPELEDCLQGSTFPGIETLSLSGCVFVRERGYLELVRSCTAIVSLSLSSCENITQSVVAAVSAKSTLRNIDLSFCGLSPRCIAAVFASKGAESLSLRGNALCTDGALVDGMARMASLKTLDARNIEALDEAILLRAARRNNVETVLLS
ncbi:MAG: cyclic nucleotide-binding domain protein [Amphiamblys sp. WSBS2006]|nr:MAG: cyclic nucleotide-binding domain protein [Amphiamblys sp. WSBS2006]